MHIVSKTYFARGFHDNDVLPTLNKQSRVVVHVRGNRSGNIIYPTVYLSKFNKEIIQYSNVIFRMYLGEKANCRGCNYEVFVNEAQIVYFDGVTTSGIIHAIDRVMIPNGLMEQLMEDNA